MPIAAAPPSCHLRDKTPSALYLVVPQHYETWHREHAFSELRTDLAKAGKLEENWNSYGSPVPNRGSIQAAVGALLLMEALKIQPTGLRASAEGGIGIYFMTGKRYSHLESLNSGEVVVLMYNGTGIPQVIEISDTSSMIAALEQLREYNSL